MCKNSCLGCKNYRWKETKVIRRDVIQTPEGVITFPVFGDVPHHCDVHPRYFKKWWKENSHKSRTDEDYVEPRCYEPNEFNKSLDEMISLAQEILDGLDKKKK
jgi:hypothetical protein